MRKSANFCEIYKLKKKKEGKNKFAGRNNWFHTFENNWNIQFFRKAFLIIVEKNIIVKFYCKRKTPQFNLRDHTLFLAKPTHFRLPTCLESPYWFGGTRNNGFKKKQGVGGGGSASEGLGQRGIDRLRSRPPRTLARRPVDPPYLCSCPRINDTRRDLVYCCYTSTHGTNIKFQLKPGRRTTVDKDRFPRYDRSTNRLKRCPSR